jgi:hypothetical protein
MFASLHGALVLEKYWLSDRILNKFLLYDFVNVEIALIDLLIMISAVCRADSLS